jgi:hypothetical protein
MKRLAFVAATAAALTLLLSPAANSQSKPKPPTKAKTPRLYVIDCGLLTMSGPQLFGFTKEEIGEKQPFAVPCYLVVHPKGTLMWDTRRASQRADARNFDGHENAESESRRNRLPAFRHYLPRPLTPAFGPHRQRE